MLSNIHKTDVRYVTYVIAVEGIEDTWDVAAQRSNRYPCVVQCHPAPAGFFRAMTAEQVISH